MESVVFISWLIIVLTAIGISVKSHISAPLHSTGLNMYVGMSPSTID